MSEPIAEQIMQAVRTRAAAYKSAYRSANVATWQPKNETIHVYQETIEENPEFDCFGNPPAKGWTLTAVLAAIIKPSETTTTAVDTFKNRVGSELIKAVTNVVNWHNWGGLAMNSNLSQLEDYTGPDGSGSGVRLRVQIFYRVDEDDPYVSRS